MLLNSRLIKQDAMEYDGLIYGRNRLEKKLSIIRYYIGFYTNV